MSRPQRATNMVRNLSRFREDFRESFQSTPYTPADTLALTRHREAQQEGIACEHMKIDVSRSMRGPDDDHETVFGRCGDCGEFVITTIFDGRPDEPECRLLSPAERNAEMRRVSA